MDIKKQFNEGLLTKNPVTVQLLGMCSVLAITTSLFNGLGMGLSVTIILMCSNILISALRKVIPSQIRIAAYIVIIAGFVTIVDLLLKAFLPALSESLGVFIYYAPEKESRYRRTGSRQNRSCLRRFDHPSDHDERASPGIQ